MKTTHCLALSLVMMSATASAEGIAVDLPLAHPVVQPVTNGPAAQAPNQNASANMNQQLMNMLKQGKNNKNQKGNQQPQIPDIGSMLQSAGPGPDTDWSKFEYADDQVFSYGGRGAGNIGNGLCLEKNKDKTQVKNGYCQMLSEILRDSNSCANRAMNNIIAKSNGVSHLGEYCSTFRQMGTNKSEVFLQFLAALITNESGWNTHATEKGWYKGGKLMQGKGLFQIGADDRSKDSDCSSLNESSIYDAKTNMKCGACIALKFIDEDNNMGEGTGDSGARGAARYFGPLRDGQSSKRQAMASAVNNYCVASTGGGSSSNQIALSSGGGAGSSR